MLATTTMHISMVILMILGISTDLIMYAWALCILGLLMGIIMHYIMPSKS